MFLIGLGALLVLCGVLYMIRTAIWHGPLSGRDSSRPVPDTLEPPTRSMRFLGVSANWPGILMMAIGAVLMLSAASLKPPSPGGCVYDSGAGGYGWTTGS